MLSRLFRRSRSLFSAVRSLFSKEKTELELDRELRLHLELEIEKYLKQGLSQQAARVAALKNFGAVQQVKEDCRDVWPGASFDALLRDLRYSFRALIKSPGFTAVVVLSLAVGIGASSAVFSVVNSLLLRPYPFPSLDELVLIKETGSGGGPADNPVAPADFLDLRADTGAFRSIAAFRFRGFNMSSDGDPETVEGYRVTPDFFDLIGIQPAMGRGFDSDQDQEGKDRSVILRYGFWQRRFAGDPQVLGRTITLDGNSFTVTGIMPDGFNYPLGGDLWVPLALTFQEKTDRSAQSLFVIGRLADSVALDQALARVHVLAGRLQEQYPRTNMGRTMALQRLREEQYSYSAPLFLTLQGAALLVLLLACANVTNILLARVIGRQREIAIRRALGSSRVSVVRLFLSEAFLLSSLAGVAAVVLAYWSANLIRVGIPEGMSKWIAGWNDIKLDGRVLGFTFLLTCAVAVIFGLAAALQSARFDLNHTLKQTSAGAGAKAGRRRVQGALVVAEIVLSLVLLVAAGLMIKGFFRQVMVFQGFQPANVLVMRMSLPENRYGDAETRNFFERVLGGLAALPGVESAATTRNTPASNVDNPRTSFTIEGRPALSPGQTPAAESQTVSEGFFRTLQVPLLDGRAFSELDGSQTPRVAIISQSMAQRFWTGQDPLGGRIKLGSPDSDSPWLSIVGVCGDMKQNWWDPVARPIIYLPSSQAPARSTYFVIRTVHNPMQIVGRVRAEISRVDPSLPLDDLSTLEREVADSVAPLKIIGTLMFVFGALALVLSAGGVFSLMAYSVAERTHEFGLRVALGASPKDVLGMVHKQTLKLAVAGLVLALPTAFVLARVMSSLLLGVVSLDVGTFAGFTILLVMVSLSAGYFPARRAARVDPIIALRCE
jgi:predicted permease